MERPHVFADAAANEQLRSSSPQLTLLKDEWADNHGNISQKVSGSNESP
jgi:hypothetical protein